MRMTTHIAYLVAFMLNTNKNQMEKGGGGGRRTGKSITDDETICLFEIN